MRIVAGVAVVALGLSSAACGERFRCADACFESAGGSPHSSQADGGEGAATEAPVGECEGDAALTPRCLIANEPGVFVSVVGGDDEHGDGSREAPFATIMRGLAEAGAQNVFVCAASPQDFYREDLSLDTAQDGVRLLGGFSCADWSYSAKRRVPVKSTTATGLHIRGLEKGALVDGFHISTLAPKTPGGSSYGAVIVNSAHVTLRRVSLTAAAGARGEDRASAAADGRDGGTSPAQSGKQASCVATSRNKGALALSCPWGSQGGDGGDGSDLDPFGLRAAPGGDGSPLGDDFETGTGAPAPDLSARNSGIPGTAGTEGKAGIVGTAAQSGANFTEKGFVPNDGHDGAAGTHGQGGGGGSGGNELTTGCTAGSGGAGGMGGEAGEPGKGGQSGGASIGLFAWQSQIELQACEIVAASGGTGGRGGAGGKGGLGAPGGAGGSSISGGTIPGGGSGGDGGRGGNGGSGSGGGGGPSLGLVAYGVELTLDTETSLSMEVGGEGGLGGSVEDVTAPSGSVGDAALRLVLP